MATLMEKAEQDNILLNYHLCRTDAQKAVWADRHARNLIEQLDLHRDEIALAMENADCSGCERAIDKAVDIGGEVKAAARVIRAALQDLGDVVLPNLLPFDQLHKLDTLATELEDLEP